MNIFSWHFLDWKAAFGVLATIGLYTVLWRENKFYRFWEHVFLGLAAGWSLVTLWVESLKPLWWDRMVGSVADKGSHAEPGFWAWAIMLPMGIAAYFVYSKKHSWIGRVPMGIIIGLWTGQQFDAWANKYIPQIDAAMIPLIPTNFGLVPYAPPSDTAANELIRQNVYLSQAIGNTIATVTLLSVLAYFLFGVELKSKFMLATTKLGRYLLMVGFGAIFGSTVMMRFSLLIDRMYFIWIEFVQKVLFHMGV